jgi:MFS family permease
VSASPADETALTATASASASIWRHRPFLLLSAARFCAVSASQMQAVGVGWQVYDTTRSAFALGLVGLAQFLPLVLLALFAGHAADRFRRRPLLGFCYALELAATAGIGLVVLAGVSDPRPIYALVALFAAARAFESPTSQSLLPALVPPEFLSRAVAGAASANQIAVIAAPALGGLLYGFGGGLVFAACALALAVAITAVALLPASFPRPGRGRLSLASLFAGIAFIRHQPVVLGAISLDLFAVLLGGATALLPVFARDILQAGPLGLGLLRSAPAVGACAMAFLLARHPIERRAGHIMFASVILFGTATILFGMSASIPLSVAALLLLGAADMVSMVIRQTLIQLMSPDALRGRVSAVGSLFVGTSNQLGEFRAGVMGGTVGPVGAVVLGGIATLAIAILWLVLFPALRTAQSLRTPPPALSRAARPGAVDASAGHS